MFGLGLELGVLEWNVITEIEVYMDLRFRI